MSINFSEIGITAILWVIVLFGKRPGRALAAEASATSLIDETAGRGVGCNSHCNGKVSGDSSVTSIGELSLRISRRIDHTTTTANRIIAQVYKRSIESFTV